MPRTWRTSVACNARLPLTLDAADAAAAADAVIAVLAGVHVRNARWRSDETKQGRCVWAACRTVAINSDGATVALAETTGPCAAVARARADASCVILLVPLPGTAPSTALLAAIIIPSITCAFVGLSWLCVCECACVLEGQ